jgi:hypothetical protein
VSLPELAVLSAPDAGPDLEPGANVRQAACHSCGAVLATVIIDARDLGIAEQAVERDRRSVLEPGFLADPGRRHWYIPAKDDPERVSPSVHLPVVLVCRCGRPNLLDRPAGIQWHARPDDYWQMVISDVDWNRVANEIADRARRSG